MRATLLVLVLLVGGVAEAKQHRDPAQKRAFVQSAPGGTCPATGKRALPCPGYEVHHVVPLYCGGVDRPSNMVWLSAEQHRSLHKATDCRRSSR